MRTAFIQELIEQARAHPRLSLVVGDLGYSVVEPFARAFPGRFLNAGVAEQNLTSLAAGLASEGEHVFTYSIANFPTLRCLEQIRNDVCHHGFPVTIVAVGAGLAYGHLGYSHHAVQDLAVMRTLPGMVVLSPADPGETVACVRWIVAHPQPSYLRLGKAGEPVLHGVTGIERGPLAVGAGDGPMALVATGSILRVALEVARRWADVGRPPLPVYSCPILRAGTPAWYAPLWRHDLLITLEEHGLAGGFGSFLRELAPATVRFHPLGLPAEPPARVGSQTYLRRQAGLDADTVFAALGTLADAGSRSDLGPPRSI